MCCLTGILLPSSPHNHIPPLAILYLVIVIVIVIAFVNHGSRVVRFSMRPHVIEYRPPTHLPPLGDIVRDTLVKVTDADIDNALFDSLHLSIYVAIVLTYLPSDAPPPPYYHHDNRHMDGIVYCR